MKFFRIHLPSFIIQFAAVIMLAMAIGCSDNGGEDHAAGAVYHCPMHPEVVSDKPGVCPICHMDLVLKDGNDAMEEHLADSKNGTDGLSITHRKQVLANISTVKVKRENIVNTISAYSYLDFAEQNRKFITARFNGRIEKLFADRTGTYISKGEPLFEIYSPDLVQAQNEYLLALNGLQIAQRISSNSTDQYENPVLNSAKQKLHLYGLTGHQIAELEKTKNVNYTITYHSPFSGTIIEKKIQEGMYVNEGTVIYDVADLSTIWNIAEVYENDLNTIKTGSKVKLSLNSYPGEFFTGTVNLIYPVVNADTRTIKIRSSFSNPVNKLKPNMYGETVFSANLGNALVIPEEAVLFTGDRKIVWVKTAERTFEPRTVTTGVKYNGKYQILSGLKDGEEVAASGAYLIDSESQLRSGLSGTGHQNHREEAGKENSSSPEHTSKSNDHSVLSAEIWNIVCPVLGRKVNSKVETVSYEGKEIGFCCAGCDKKFNTNPEEYLSNLSIDGSQYIGEKN